jgi:hypothetical protein
MFTRIVFILVHVAFMSHSIHVSQHSCLTTFMSHSIHVSQHSCLTAFMSHIIHVSQHSCLTAFMSHSIHVSQHSCLTTFMSHSIHVSHHSCLTTCVRAYVCVRVSLGVYMYMCTRNLFLSVPATCICGCVYGRVCMNVSCVAAACSFHATVCVCACTCMQSLSTHTQRSRQTATCAHHAAASAQKARTQAPKHPCTQAPTCLSSVSNASSFSLLTVNSRRASTITVFHVFSRTCSRVSHRYVCHVHILRMNTSGITHILYTHACLLHTQMDSAFTDMCNPHIYTHVPLVTRANPF